MRADDDLRFAATDLLQESFALFAFVAACEDDIAQICGIQPWAHGLAVLAGEDFGGGEEGCLGAVFHRVHHGERGDDCFTAADIALEQAHHFAVIRHVFVDFAQGAFLCAC